MTGQASHLNDNRQTVFNRAPEGRFAKEEVLNLADDNYASLPPVPEEESLNMEETTRHEETSFERQPVEEITSMSQLSKLIASIDNPVRDISVELRSQLDAFIEANMRDPIPMGFLAVQPEPVSVKEIHQSLHQASRILEEIFVSDEDRSPFGISLRSFAQNLQSSVDQFRVYLVRSGYLKGVSESSTSEILHNCLQFKSELSGVIQEMDAYIYKHTITSLASSEE